MVAGRIISHFCDNGYRLPFNGQCDSELRGYGAKVTQPVPGVYLNVSVTDFASFYPRVMEGTT